MIFSGPLFVNNFGLSEKKLVRGRTHITFLVGKKCLTVANFSCGPSAVNTQPPKVITRNIFLFNFLVCSRLCRKKIADFVEVFRETRGGGGGGAYYTLTTKIIRLNFFGLYESCFHDYYYWVLSEI